MNELNITVESGKTRRLKTAGTWSEKDILVTGTGSSGEIVDANIYDPEANPVESGTFSSSTLVNSNSTTRLRVRGFVAVEPNTPYRISTNIARVLVVQVSTDKKVIANTGWRSSGYTFITSSTCAYFRITLANASDSTITLNNFEWLKIEKYSIGDSNPVVQALEVTENGTYTAPEGVDGYSPVTVNVPIPDGYIKPSGTKEITENGTHDAKAYESVNVNVPIPEGYEDVTTETDEYTVKLATLENALTALEAELEGKAAGGGTELEDAFLTRTISGDYSNHRVTKISSYMFQRCNELTSVDFPNVETIGANAFQACTKLKSLDFPKCKTLDAHVFASCNGVLSANFPVLTSIGRSFDSCTAMKTFYAPMLQTVGNQAFYFCSDMVKFDLPSLTSIGTHAFNNCSKMTALILGDEKICTLANVNGLINTPVAKGTGYVYVPKNLLETYAQATNWSTYAAQFRAIEDYPEICGGGA